MILNCFSLPIEMNKKDKAASISGYSKRINSLNPLVYPAHKKKIEIFKLEGIIWM